MSTTATPAVGAALTPASAHATRGPILVAATGDDGSAAIQVARHLAARGGRGVRVISAVELPPAAAGYDGMPLIPDVAGYAAAQRTRVERQLDAVGDAPRAWPVDVVVGEPAHTIVEAARAHGASLIVLGTGRHDLAARMLGEVALRVIRRAPCPVLTVPLHPFDPADVVPAHVAVAAIDFSPASVVAARAALDLLAPGATLHLVHVWQRHVLETEESLARDAAYERALPDRLARVERELLVHAPHVTILATSLVGDPCEKVVALATVHGATLIAAGRQGHRLLELLFVGRVTTALVRAAPCAVLVTPEPSAAERDVLRRLLSETSESRDHAEWGALLDGFWRRNAGRRTRLEVDDPALGAQTAESGWVLTGAAYDPHDGRVTLMFGAPTGPTTHLTRGVERVTSLGLLTGHDGRDTALRLTHGDGQTLLTFTT